MCLHRIFFVVVFTFFSFSACENDSPKKETTLPTQQDTIPVGPRWSEINRIRMILQPDGRWGYDITDDDKKVDQRGTEFPKGSGYYVTYAGGLFIGAMKDGTPAVVDFSYGTELTPGRITNSNVAPISQLTSSSSDSARILFLSSESDEDSPDLKQWPPDYGGPWDSISSSPIRISHLDTWSASHDLNADSLSYDPGQPVLGLEVHRMTYAQDGEPWNNTILIRYQIINKSDQNYSNTYISWWLDHNLGNEIHNDAPATDTLLNLIYTYNLSDEQTSTGKQYALGHCLLYFSQNGVLSRWSSTYAYGGGEDPISNLERYRMQQGGINHKTGNAVDSAFAGSVGGKYVYPGDPVTGTGTLCKQGRNGRLVGTVGPFILESGKTYDLVVAVIGGEGIDRLFAITELRMRSEIIKNLFNSEAYKFKLK